MTAIEFSVSSYPGAIPQEGAGRLINAMAEKIGDDIKYIRSPGVRRYFATPPADNAAGFRGMNYLANTLWVGYTDKLYQSTTQTGGLLTRVPDSGGSLVPFTGTDPVFFAQNMRATANGPDVVAARATGGAFQISGTGTPGIITHPVGGGLPVNQVVDVAFGLGFLFYGISDGRCFASDLNSVNVQAVNFTTANTKPDGLYRAIWFGQQLYLVGPDSMEVWGLPINATGFPLNLVTSIPRGIVGPRAITGFENGCDLGLVFVSKNSQVMRLNGAQPERISEPDLERAIAATDPTTIECTTFNVAGHMFLKVRSPLWCWLYDFSTQTWHERASWLSVTSRTRQATLAFGTLWLVGDDNTTDLGLFSNTTFDEFNRPLVWGMDSKPVEGFPSRVVVGPAHFHFAPGTGNSNQPTIAITNITQASPTAVINVVTNGLHNLAVGDTVFITGVVGMLAPPPGGGTPTSQINGRQFLVSASGNISFNITDLNGVTPDTTVWTAYTSGGTVRKQFPPPNAVAPQVQISWSNDDGVNFGAPELKALGAQGNSTQLIRTFLTGSFAVYGRIWRLQVSDPVYVSFYGGEMPRIGKRAAA